MTLGTLSPTKQNFEEELTETAKRDEIKHIRYYIANLEQPEEALFDHYKKSSFMVKKFLLNQDWFQRNMFLNFTVKYKGRLYSHVMAPVLFQKIQPKATKGILGEKDYGSYTPVEFPLGNHPNDGITQSKYKGYPNEDYTGTHFTPQLEPKLESIEDFLTALDISIVRNANVLRALEEGREPDEKMLLEELKEIYGQRGTIVYEMYKQYHIKFDFIQRLRTRGVELALQKIQAKGQQSSQLEERLPSRFIFKHTYVDMAVMGHMTIQDIEVDKNMLWFLYYIDKVWELHWQPIIQNLIRLLVKNETIKVPQQMCEAIALSCEIMRLMNRISNELKEIKIPPAAFETGLTTKDSHWIKGFVNSMIPIVVRHHFDTRKCIDLVCSRFQFYILPEEIVLLMNFIEKVKGLMSDLTENSMNYIIIRIIGHKIYFLSSNYQPVVLYF